jgi:hypothetical protein
MWSARPGDRYRTDFFGTTGKRRIQRFCGPHKFHRRQVDSGSATIARDPQTRSSCHEYVLSEQGGSAPKLQPRALRSSWAALPKFEDGLSRVCDDASVINDACNGDNGLPILAGFEEGAGDVVARQTVPSPSRELERPTW